MDKQDVISRFTLKNERKDILKFYYDQRAIMWQSEEVKFHNDKKNYEMLNPRYKEIYKMFLAFFSCGDSAITEQALGFLTGAVCQEERMFLVAQLLNETDHALTYTRAVKEVLPVSEQEEVFNSVIDNVHVKEKKDFIMRWCENETESRAVKYFAGALTEGVFFTSLFALIFFFRRKNVFTDFIDANKFILRDETLHRDFNIFMASYLNGEEMKFFDKEKAYAIAREAYEIEIRHMKFILEKPVDSVESDQELGLSVENMTLYIQTLVDQILVLSGMEPLFNVPVTTFKWMEDMTFSNKSNFYEKLVTEYSTGHKACSSSESDHESF